MTDGGVTDGGATDGGGGMAGEGLLRALEALLFVADEPVSSGSLA